MKGNQQLFSSRKADRIKGYRKLFKKNADYYKPSGDIAQGLVEAMHALGFEITTEEALAYLKSSYAVHDRDYYVKHFRMAKK